MGLMDLISSKIELFRLEQRYTKRRNRRSTFVSDAQYVDGEYIYSSPSPTLSKRHSILQFPSSSQESMSTVERGSRDGQAAGAGVGFDAVVKEGAGAERGKRRGWNSARATKRRSMVTVQEIRWEDRL